MTVSACRVAIPTFSRNEECCENCVASWVYRDGPDGAALPALQRHGRVSEEYLECGVGGVRPGRPLRRPHVGRDPPHRARAGVHELVRAARGPQQPIKYLNPCDGLYLTARSSQASLSLTVVASTLIPSPHWVESAATLQFPVRWLTVYSSPELKSWMMLYACRGYLLTMRMIPTLASPGGGGGGRRGRRGRWRWGCEAGASPSC